MAEARRLGAWGLGVDACEVASGVVDLLAGLSSG
jgi:hypothetical protein